MTQPFTPELIAAAQASEAKFYPLGPFVSISLAQWAVESAYGRAQSGKNNFFGIKANAAQIAAGKATACRTREFIDGEYQTEVLYFADYASLQECFDAHATLLTEPSLKWAYGECWTAPTPQAYAIALGKHYATAPNYPEVLMGVINQWSLTQYDVKR